MDESPLKKLPPELRNRIYELAMRRDSPIVLDWLPKMGKYQAGSDFNRDRPLVLTQVCRQTRAECTRLFFAVNTLVLGCGGNFYSVVDATHHRMNKFLAAIGADNAAVAGSVIFSMGIVRTRELKSLDRAVAELVRWLELLPQLRLRVRIHLHSNTIGRLVTMVLDLHDLAEAYSAAEAEVERILAKQTDWRKEAEYRELLSHFRLAKGRWLGTR